MAIPPGTHEAVFGYEIPISGETLEIRKTMSMPVADFTVFSQLPPGSVQGLGPATAMADFNAEHYPTAAYDAGQTLEFKVVGFTAEYSDARDIVILSGVFAVVVLLASTALSKAGRASLRRPPCQTHMITLKSISKAFEHRPVLKNVDLAIGSGESVFLCGINGVGKSTLLRIAADCFRPMPAMWKSAAAI